MTRVRLGMTFTPAMRPDQLRPLAEATERAGLDDLWLWEDCFNKSGLAPAVAALAWTERVRVGVSLFPAPLRNVALAAMEVATVVGMFPGRFVPGIGHGVQEWMAQAGARVASPMTLLEEYAVALRRLLAGEEVSVSGQHVRLDRVKLAYPPAEPVPLMLGGYGPKTLALAARLGAGTMLAAALTDEHVDAGTAVVASVRSSAAALVVPGEHEVVAGKLVTIGPGAHDRLARTLTQWQIPAGAGSGVAGDASAVAAGLQRWVDRGVTTIAVVPTADEPDLAGLCRFVAEEVAPLLRAPT
ncbi:MAG TPA: LLM class flavin-dependent oxidoreductase [Dermatophilaceae bacterium]|nr:LLM class flavin-dependent oxidoreductase [Dermatophilaceae bacterium]